eukprot:tig00000204_g17726.t2
MPAAGSKILGQQRKAFDYKLSKVRLPGEQQAAAAPQADLGLPQPEALGYHHAAHGAPPEAWPLDYGPVDTSASYLEAPYAQWIQPHMPPPPAHFAAAGARVPMTPAATPGVLHPAAPPPTGETRRSVTLRGRSPPKEPPGPGRAHSPRFAARPHTAPAPASPGPVPARGAAWGGGDGFHVSTLTLNRSLNLDSYIPGRSVGKIKLRILAKWVDSLNVAPPVTDLCIRLRTGNLLCALLERLEPSLQLKGVVRKPVVADSCVHNIEIALQHLFKKNVQYQNMPTAREIFEARPGAVLRLLGEVFDVYVVQPARAQLRVLLSWYFGTVARYGVLDPRSVASIQPGPAAATLLRETLASGTAWCCVMHCHAADAGFDLGLVFRQPAALEEVLNNLEYAAEFSEQLGVPWYWWSPADCAAFPADDVVLAQLHALYSYFKAQGKLSSGAPRGAARGLQFADSERIEAARIEAEQQWANERAAVFNDIVTQRIAQHSEREAVGRQRKQLAYYAELAERERQMDERSRLSPFLQAKRMQRMKERLENERILRLRRQASEMRWGAKSKGTPAAATAGSAAEGTESRAGREREEGPGRLWPRLIRRIETERDVEWVPVDVKASLKATRAARAAQSGAPPPHTGPRNRLAGPAAPAHAPARAPPPASGARAHRRRTRHPHGAPCRPAEPPGAPRAGRAGRAAPAGRLAPRLRPRPPGAGGRAPALARVPSGRSVQRAGSSRTTPRESPRGAPRAPEEEEGEEDLGQLQSYLSTIPSSMTGRPGARQPTNTGEGFEFEEPDEQTTDHPMYSEGLRTVAEESVTSEGAGFGREDGAGGAGADGAGDHGEGGDGDRRGYDEDDAATGYSARGDEHEPFGEDGFPQDYSPGWGMQQGQAEQGDRRGWEQEVHELFEDEGAHAGNEHGYDHGDGEGYEHGALDRSASPTAVGPGSQPGSAAASPHRASAAPSPGAGYGAAPSRRERPASAGGTPRARPGLPPPPVPVSAPAPAPGPAPAAPYYPHQEEGGTYVDEPVPVRAADFTWGGLDVEQLLSERMPRILEPRGWSRGEWEGAAVHIRSTLFEPKLYHLLPPPGAPEDAEPSMYVFQVEMDVPEAYGPALVWRDLDSAELVGAVELLHLTAVERELSGTTITMHVAPPGGTPASVQFMTGEYEERDGYTWATMLFCFLLKGLHRTPMRLTEDDMDWIRNKAEMVSL